MKRAATEGPWTQPKSIRVELQELLDAVNPGKLGTALLQSAWEKAAGPGVCREARIVGFREGTLTIAVASSVLLFELKGYRGKQLLKTMAAALPGGRLQRLQFVPGSRGF